MRNVKQSALVASTPRQMFELINDVRHYPAFVPGCSAAEVLSQGADEIVARLTIGKGPVGTAFTTRNRLDPERRISMELVEGPFNSLNGIWTLTPVMAPGSQDIMGCKVELDLTFELAGGLSRLTLGPLMERMASTLVTAFVDRARQLRGS